MASWELRPPAGFRLEPVVYSHGWFQCAPFEWIPETRTLIRVLDLPGRSTRVVDIHEPRPGALTLKTAGRRPSPVVTAAIEESVGRILSFDADLGPFHELCRRHPRLETVPELAAGRILRCPTLWEELVKAICGTNVAWTQAVRMIGRLCELGQPVEGGRHAWPQPAQVLAAGETVLRERCRVGYRAGSILELASRLEEGALDLEPAERGELAESELRALFLSVKGIGKATAAYLMILHGYFREVTIDSATYAYTADAYFEGRKPSDAEIRELYAPFGEWAALAHWFDAITNAWWPASGIELPTVS